MTSRLILAFAVALPLLARPARADESNAAAAAQLFADARRLMKQGAYADACPKLAQSQRLDPGIGTLYNLADCHEHVGRTATAWREYLEVAAKARAGGQRAREDAARARATALEPRLPRLTILVRTNEDGLVVTRDGTEIARAQWRSATPVDPGEHTILARAPNRAAWRRAVTAMAGETTQIEVPALEEAPAPTPIPSSSHVARSERAPPRPPNRTPAIATLTAAAVGIGAGAAFGLVSKSKHDDAGHHCTGNVCDAAGVGLRDDARRAGTISTIAFIAGGAALAGGLLLWFTATPPASSSSSSAALVGVRGVF
jgi:hypothetical protein